jgi:Domain of unknown function (DUF222)
LLPKPLISLGLLLRESSNTCTIEGMETATLSTTDVLEHIAAAERLVATVALEIAALEASGNWAADGAVSFNAWLRHHGRMTHAGARKWQHHGRFLRRFPAIGSAECTSVLSADQVGLVRNACPARLEPILEEQQEALVEILAPLDTGDTQRACHVWSLRADAIIDTPLPTERERSLRFGADSTGAIVGNFVLPGQAGSEFAQAVRTATTWNGAEDTRTTTEKHADALFEIAAFYNKNHEVPGTPRNHPHVELSLDASTLHDLPIAIDSNGQVVDPVTTDTMLCHCAMHQVQRDNHAVLAYGRSQYTASHSLFRSVAARDGGCRFPGCDRPVRFCDAHHIRHWRHGGNTDHHNLLLLCSRHHHHVHKHSLDVKLLPDASVEITWADGRRRTSRPRGRPPTARAA